MRRLLTSSVMALGLAFAAPALSKSSRSFETNVTAPINTPIKIEVVLSEDLAYRADNLPKKLRDRSSSGRLNSAFSSNGFYGERDLNQLTERLERKVTQRLEKKGVNVSPDAGTTLKLVLTDARPNRPTFKQLSKDVSLSFQSFGLGGARFEGELVAASGETLGNMSYAFFENDIRHAGFGGTWTDANRAIDRFARKTAKTLAE